MKKYWFILLVFFLCGCDQLLNSPYPKEDEHTNIYYSSFDEQPKTLDPAKSYSSNEYMFIAQIYEPPLQYHYLLRPLTLIPLNAKEVPKPIFFDKNNQKLPDDIERNEVAYTVYRITIKPNIFYQPHPALSKNADGSYTYHALKPGQLDEESIEEILDFKHTGTRELIADDYVYQIKRLAHPAVQSPIFGLMQEHIRGLSALGERLKLKYSYKEGNNRIYEDLKNESIEGVRVIDRYTYEITVNGAYPQFVYWLAMPFFSPLPWEADEFYAQPNMDDANMSLDWFPIGTGPYMLVVNNPNRMMKMVKNPNFHGETYPDVGMPEDSVQGLLKDSLQPLPFIDTVIFTLEKETIPRWNKFLQGYYDLSGISSDSFDEAIKVDEYGQIQLTPSIEAKGIYLQTSIAPSVYYLGFNMMDPVVGGLNEKGRLLRQAISKAIDYEEFISIFMNGRGVVANGPIPPGIFGYEIENNSKQSSSMRAQSLLDAKKLLEQAGYKNGIDPATGKQLILNYDVPASTGPDDKARLDWMRKQFANIGIDLYVQASQYNHFQEKVRKGNVQLFTWGWHADYPDPENFLFLLYGPNSKVAHGGENASNYQNAEFDQLFDQIKNMPNTSKRAKLIHRMLTILRYDAPWVWGFYPKDFILAHQWFRRTKPSEIANNTLKYAKIDPSLRALKRKEWNQPIFIPIIIVLGLLAISLLPVLIQYKRMIRKPIYR